MDFLNPVDVEWAVVGILANGKTRLDSELPPEAFSDAGARRAFEAERTLTAQGRSVTLAALDEALTRGPGGDALMGRVMDAQRENLLNGWRLNDAVKVVREAAMRREFIRTAEALAAGARDPERNLDELSDGVTTRLKQNAVSRGGWITLESACLNAYESAEHRVPPISTGIQDLDSILCGGLRPGELTLLGARPAVGKSALLLAIAIHAALDGRRVLFISLEMSGQQLGARALASFGGCNPALLSSGNDLRQEQWAKLGEALCASGGLNERLHVLVRGGLTIEELRGEIARQDAADLIVVDYLQLLCTRGKTSSDFERLGRVSRGLKSITLDAGAAILAGAQVRRQNGVSRPPTLDELRGSGDLEQDADNVILLHRPEDAGDPVFRSRPRLFEAAAAQNAQALCLDVAKQRQGRTGRAWTVFNPARMQFFHSRILEE